MLAEIIEYSIGVDPDRDRVTAVIIDTANGGEVGWEVFDTTAAGYDEMICFADSHCQPDQRAWAIEGTGSYGSGATQVLRDAGEWVIEYSHPAAPAARDAAKSDRLDAIRAAREVLGTDKWAQPRARGDRESLRVLYTSRETAVSARTVAINQLKAMLVTAPVELRDQLVGGTATALVGRCARLRPCGDDESAMTKTALRSLAQRIGHLADEIDRLGGHIDTITQRMAPQLLDECGIGPITAAIILIAWSHPGRFANEASFARLAGVAPIEATSGQDQTRHRLNRHGDRQLNRALHGIVLTRTRVCEETREYIHRRTTQDHKTKREARRCLKRYVARRIYRILEHTQQPDQTEPATRT